MQNNNRKIVIFTIVSVLVVFASTYFSYLYITNDNEYIGAQNDMVLNSIYPIASTKTIEKDIPINRITKDTDIQYNYKENGVLTNTVTQKAKNSIINFTEEDLRNTLEDIEIVKFDNDLVILEKNVLTNEASYIVGEQNGYVSIFYKDTNNKVILLNQTRILIKPLPEQDKKLLKQGIEAKDNTELMKIIEDYQS